MNALRKILEEGGFSEDEVVFSETSCKENRQEALIIRSIISKLPPELHRDIFTILYAQKKLVSRQLSYCPLTARVLPLEQWVAVRSDMGARFLSCWYIRPNDLPK